MSTKTSIININASQQRVWDCLTNPELVKAWQYGSILTTDWSIGSSIDFVTPWDGKEFKQWGKVLEFNPTDSLSYSLFAPRPDLEDKPENYFIMKYRLSENGKGTTVTIIQEDNRPGATDEEESAGEENPILQGLKKLAENEQ